MKIQSPWMGRIKGSAGNMTGCKVYDKNVMRAKAFEVSNPNTQGQQTQRNFFAELTTLVSTFTEAQLRTLFPSKPKAMSRRNALSKQLAVSYAVDGTTKSIDFADIVTIGNAPSMDFSGVTADLNDGTLYSGLGPIGEKYPQFYDNRVIVLIVNETKKELSLTTRNVILIDEDWECPAPTSWENTDTIHPIPLITNVLKSEQVGDFGTFNIIARPE